MDYSLSASLHSNIIDESDTTALFWKEKYELCHQQLTQFKDKVSHVRVLYNEKVSSYEQKVVAAEKKYDDALKKIEKLKLVCQDKDEAISALREKIIRMRHENDSLILLDEEKMQKVKEWVREKFKELIRETDQLKKERDELRNMCDKARAVESINSPSKSSSSHLYEEIFGELLWELKPDKYLYEPITEFSPTDMQSSCENLPPVPPARCTSIRASSKPIGSPKAKPFPKLSISKHEEGFHTSTESLNEQFLQLTEDKQISERGINSPYYYTIEEPVKDYTLYKEAKAPIYTTIKKNGTSQKEPSIVITDGILTSDTTDTESDGDPTETHREVGSTSKLQTCATFTAQNMKQEKLERVGWLTKQGGIIKNWKKRWFVLSDGKLHYFKRQEDMNRKPIGQVDLEKVSRIAKTVDPLTIELATPLRTFYVTADTLSEADGWLEVLSKCLRRFNGSTSMYKSIENALFSGWVIQTRCGVSKRYWAVLKEKSLLFFKTDKLQTPVYVINLLEIICVEPVVEEKFKKCTSEEDCGFRFVIECLKDSHPTYIEVGNKLEMDNWIHHLYLSCSGTDMKKETPFEELITKLMHVDGDTSSPHWRNHLIVHSKSILECSLTALSTELEKEAKNLSKSIHLFCNTPINDSAIDYHIALSQDIIQLCLTNKELQTEFYCQLIKQTTKLRSGPPVACNNNYSKSNDWLTSESSMNTIDLKPIASYVYLQCWQLIALSCSVFLPKLKVLWLLKAHILRNANENSANGRYAIYCQRSLERMLQNGERECKPSRIEVLSIIASNPFYRLYPISIPVYFVNNTYQMFTFDGSTTVDEICKKINEEIGIRDNNESGYALYSDNPVVQAYHYLQGDVKVCDAISRWEQVAHQFKAGKVKRSDSIKLIYKNRLFFLSAAHLLTERERLLHVFEVAEYIRIGHLVPTANNLAKLTALYSQIEYGDFIEHYKMLEELMINYPHYNNIPNPSIKRKILKNVSDIWSSLKGKSVNECCQSYIDVVKSIPLYGSKLFKAKEKLVQSNVPNANAQHLWIAVYEMKIQILSNNKELISDYDWSQVVTFGGYKQDFMLVVQQRGDGPDNTTKHLLAMPPNLVLDLTLLIAGYINALVTKSDTKFDSKSKQSAENFVNDDYCQVWNM